MAVYPLFGYGLGAYESVMAHFTTAAPMKVVDFAHNEWLQLVAEGGVSYNRCGPGWKKGNTGQNATALGHATASGCAFANL